MKKVKITILKTTLDKGLAAEYGIDGLTACPMMKAGDVFYADYAKPRDSATRRGRRSTSMCLRWRTARTSRSSTTATGSRNPASPS